MLLFSAREIEVSVSEQTISDFAIKTYTLQLQKLDKVLFVATDKLNILFDLNGQVLIEPEVIEIFNPLEICNVESTYLFLELPINFSQTIDNNIFNWFDVLYVELLNGFNTNDLAIDKAFLDSIANTIKNTFSAEFIKRRNLSERQKRRLYESIGINQTLLRRAKRFTESVKRFDEDLQEFDLQDYVDQSHFIKECKQFTGLTPAKIVKFLGNVRFLQ
jgi:hypothetical protein